MPGLFQVSAKGIYLQEQQALLLQGELDSKKRLWDLPGGRVEQGEHPPEALIREVSEELPSLHNASVEDLLLAELSWHLEDKCELVVLYYQIIGDLKSVELTDEHIGYRWVNTGFLATTDTADFFDKGMKPAIQQALG